MKWLRAISNVGIPAAIGDGSVSATPYLSIPLAFGSTTPTFLSQAYGGKLLFPSGLYVKVTGGTITRSVGLE